MPTPMDVSRTARLAGNRKNVQIMLVEPMLHRLTDPREYPVQGRRTTEGHQRLDARVPCMGHPCSRIGAFDAGLTIPSITGIGQRWRVRHRLVEALSAPHVGARTAPKRGGGSDGQADDDPLFH